MRVEGRVWTLGTAEIEKDTTATAGASAQAYATQKPPPYPPEFVKSALTTAAATLFQINAAVEVLPPSMVVSNMDVVIGDAAPMPLSEWVKSGRATIEQSADGWFAINFVMPSTFAGTPAYVCFKERPTAKKMKLGRALNMTPAAMNESCPWSCLPWHGFALGWKAGNPARERDVYQARLFKVLVHHLRKLANEKEYFVRPQEIVAGEIDRFVQNDPVPPLDDSPTEFCPRARWPAPMDGAFGERRN